MNIAVDIDDTLTNSFTYFQSYVAEFFGTSLQELTDKNISYSNLPASWQAEELAFCRKYYDRIVPKTPFKPDAAWGIAQLRQRGHRIIIITGRTTAFYTDPVATTQTELANGQIQYDQLICTLNKAKACQQEEITIFLDDLVKNCQAVAQVQVQPILFNSPENTQQSSQWPRVNDWHQAVGLIESMTD